MNGQLEECPYCHNTIMKGAMRCTVCGKILQTPKERIATIKKIQSKNKFSIKRFFTFIVKIMILGVLYYFFSDRIIEIVKDLFGK